MRGQKNRELDDRNEKKNRKYSERRGKKNTVKKIIENETMKKKKYINDICNQYKFRGGA